MDYRKKYEEWLNNDVFDQDTKNELAALTDEKEIEDRFYRELSFGTAGMRGVLGAGTNRMNLYNVRRASKGVAKYLMRNPEFASRGVAIAYDSRRYSDLFAKETALILCENGVPVYLYESLRPVPVLSFTLRYLNCAAGVVITASHNPPEYNGYKLYGEDGAQIGPDIAEIVTEEIQKLDYKDCYPMDEKKALESGLLKIIGKAEDDAYIKMLHTLVVDKDILKKEGSNLKIVYSPLHGSGNMPVRRILDEIGITNVSVVKEQENPDPNFSTVAVPNPEDPGAFKLAIELANKVGADCAFATDPDCDRLGVAFKTESGEFKLLNGNQIACIMLYYILSTKQKQGKIPKNGAIIKSIVSTEMARKIADSYGVATFETLTGFKFIGEKIQQFEDDNSYEFIFAFEESYGFLSGSAVRDKDAVNASMLIAEAVCSFKAQGLTLNDALNEMYNKYGWYLDKVISKTLPGKDGSEKMAAIMNNLFTNYPESIAGLKVVAVRDYKAGTRKDIATGESKDMGLPPSAVLYYELEGGNWVCVRPSGTEPKIKLYINANAETEEEAKALLEKLANAAENLIS
ncbi:MAG: phospho-sugar mutase [Christensenellaceae bacterium]|nr:phospho-sugar mutase [Christensenellaceae bacterium]